MHVPVLDERDRQRRECDAALAMLPSTLGRTFVVPVPVVYALGGHFPDPRVLERAGRGRAIRRRALQQRRYEVLGRVADAVPIWTREVESRGTHRVEYLIVGISVERGISAKEDVRYHAYAPYIAALGIFAIQNFWGDIIRGAHLSVHYPLFDVVIVTAKAEVNDLYDRGTLVLARE